LRISGLLDGFLLSPANRFRIGSSIDEFVLGKCLGLGGFALRPNVTLIASAYRSGEGHRSMTANRPS